MNPKRLRTLKDAGAGKGPVAYWMSRDQRVSDNWALLHAQERAITDKAPLLVVFCLAPSFLGATIRQYDFILKGLEEVEKTLAGKNIPFYLLKGAPEKTVNNFIKRYGIATLITDFDPLRIKREWKSTVAGSLNISFHEVDAHNIVPCWLASDKQEFAAYTIRPKIRRLMKEFLDDFPPVQKHPFRLTGTTERIDWKQVRHGLSVNHSVKPVDWLVPGEGAGRKTMEDFFTGKIEQYNELRNQPNKDGLSNLSPYLHFGHICAQRIVLDMERTGLGRGPSGAAFIEELTIRRELSDNYCLYNDFYDSFQGLPAWSQKTLNEHRQDRRDYLYSGEDFEHARTHDDLWNAAQMEMVLKGKMHGYMRMYWAKKILEWSKSPEEAYEIAIRLNDTYELDGRDPNGYTGIAWSIGGLHDRAWGERNVFGKVRYMSYGGCKSKFRIKEYMEQVRSETT